MKLEDFINKSPDQINRMSAAELSKAVAFMSRAANKRVENLKKHGYKTAVYSESGKRIGSKWVNKKNSPGVDFNAIQNLNKSFGHVNQFTNIGRLRSEYMRVKGFLSAPSSTVKGAIELRKKKERALFGATREMLAYKEGVKRGKRLTKAERAYMSGNMDEFMSSIYENYHKWREEYGMESGYTKEQGRESLARIGKLMSKGMPAGLARYNESRRLTKQYEAAHDPDNDYVDESPLNLLLDINNKDEY